ncbi:MAG: DUF2842 domain-containing protein [Pseudomonadota bacterium]
MSYRNRKRLALFVLIIGLPAYIVVATSLVNQFERPGILVELGVYVGLGIIWAFPLKWLFRGLGQPDPDSNQS